MGILVCWFVRALLSVRKYCAFSLKRELSCCARYETHMSLVVDICGHGLRGRSAQRLRILLSWLDEVVSTCRKVLNPSFFLILELVEEEKLNLSVHQKNQEAQQIS